MKNLFYKVASLFILTILISSCNRDGNTKISVVDSDHTYEFYAKFDRKKTREVQDYINSQVAPSRFVTDDELKITTTLDDKTEFELEESDGKVRITLDKDDNSVSSYQRIKKMCEGIKKLISTK